MYYERRLASVSEGEQHRVVQHLEQEKKELKRSHTALMAKTKKLEEELTFVRSVCSCVQCFNWQLTLLVQRTEPESD